MMDSTYEVIIIHRDSEYDYPEEEKLFQGNLSDCEAFIRLHEQERI